MNVRNRILAPETRPSASGHFRPSAVRQKQKLANRQKPDLSMFAQFKRSGNVVKLPDSGQSSVSFLRWVARTAFFMSFEICAAFLPDYPGLAREGGICGGLPFPLLTSFGPTPHVELSIDAVPRSFL